VLTHLHYVPFMEYSHNIQSLHIVEIFLYIYIYIYTHTHTHIYIYLTMDTALSAFCLKFSKVKENNLI